MPRLYGFFRSFACVPVRTAVTVSACFSGKPPRFAEKVRHFWTRRGVADMAPRRLLTAAEAADVLRITPIQAVKLCRTGELRATKPGKAWLINPEDLDAYLDAHSNDDLRAGMTA